MGIHTAAGGGLVWRVLLDGRRSSWIWNVFLKVEAADSNDGFDTSSTEVGLLPLAEPIQNTHFSTKLYSLFL